MVGMGNRYTMTFPSSQTQACTQQSDHNEHLRDTRNVVCCHGTKLVENGMRERKALRPS